MNVTEKYVNNPYDPDVIAVQRSPVNSILKTFFNNFLQRGILLLFKNCTDNVFKYTKNNFKIYNFTAI